MAYTSSLAFHDHYGATDQSFIYVADWFAFGNRAPSTREHPATMTQICPILSSHRCDCSATSLLARLCGDPVQSRSCFIPSRQLLSVFTILFEGEACYESPRRAHPCPTYAELPSWSKTGFTKPRSLAPARQGAEARLDASENIQEMSWPHAHENHADCAFCFPRFFRVRR